MDHIFITPFNSPRGGATETVPPNLSRNSNDGYNRVLRPSTSYSIRSPLGVSLDTGRAKSVRGQSTPPTPITSYAFSDAPQSGPTKTSGGAAYVRHAAVAPSMALSANPGGTWRAQSAATSPLAKAWEATHSSGSTHPSGSSHPSPRYHTSGAGSYDRLHPSKSEPGPEGFTEGSGVRREGRPSTDPPSPRPALTLGDVGTLRREGNQSIDTLPPRPAMSPSRTPPASPLAYTRIVNNPSGVAGARTAPSSTKTRGVLYSAVRPSTAGTAGGGGGGGNAGGMAAVASGNVVCGGLVGSSMSTSARRTVAHERRVSATTRLNLGVSGMQTAVSYHWPQLGGQ
eukprot:gene19093-25694_t